MAIFLTTNSSSKRFECRFVGEHNTSDMLSLFNSLPILRVNRLCRTSALGISQIFARHRSQLAPRKVKWVKRQKGTIPIPIGGSTKGTTLAFGEWGIRIKGNGARFSAKQLQTVEDLIKRKIKVIKGAKVFLRVFPDVPVCIKVRTSCSFFGKRSESYRDLGE